MRMHRGIRSRSRIGDVCRHLAIEAAHDEKAWQLTEELMIAFVFFLDPLRSPEFQKGILPERFANRPMALVYTDGSRSDTERGIGGVVLGRHLQIRFFAEDLEGDHF